MRQLPCLAPTKSTRQDLNNKDSHDYKYIQDMLEEVTKPSVGILQKDFNITVRVCM